VLTSIVLAYYSKKGTKRADSSLYFFINLERIEDGTYFGWSYPSSIILSWHMSLEHYKDITRDGTAPFLKKYLA
jgi:hypothetical protein